MGLLTAALLVTGSQAALAFTISGTVRDQASVPVDGTELRLFAANGTPIGIPLTLTNLAGFYTINGLPNGSYLVQFRPPTPDRLLAAELPATIVNANLTLERDAATRAYPFGFRPRREWGRHRQHRSASSRPGYRRHGPDPR